MSKEAKYVVKQPKDYPNPEILKENQFQPGQSGNPKGPPPARTQLWRYFCIYMAMTDVKFEHLKAKRLTQAQQSAVKLVEDMKAGKLPPSSKFVQYCTDRELGKALETVKVTGREPLSDDECESIRDILRENGNRS